MFDKSLLTLTEETIQDFLRDQNVVGATVDVANKRVVLQLDEGAPDVQWDLSPIFDFYVEKEEGKDLSTNDLTDALLTSMQAAIGTSHTHDNKAELDKWSEDVDGNPLYDGQPVTDPNAHTHDNKAELDKWSEDVDGNPLYGGQPVTDPNAHTHDNKDLLDSLSIDAVTGNLEVDGVDISTLPVSVDGEKPATVANNQVWVDNSATPSNVMFFDGASSHIIGKPRVLRTLRPTQDNIPQSFWQSNYMDAISFNGRSFITLNLYGSIKVMEFITGELVEVYSSSEITWTLKFFELQGKLYMISGHNYIPSGADTKVREFTVPANKGQPLSSTTIAGLFVNMDRAGSYFDVFEESGVMYIAAFTNYADHENLNNWAGATTLYSFNGTTLDVVQNLSLLGGGYDDLVYYDGKRYTFLGEHGSNTTLKMYEVTPTGFVYVKDIGTVVTLGRSFTRSGKIYVSIENKVHQALDADFNLIPDDFIYGLSPTSHWEDPATGYIYYPNQSGGSTINMSIFDGVETITKPIPTEYLGARVLLSDVFLLDGEPYTYSVRADNPVGGKLYKLEY